MCLFRSRSMMRRRTIMLTVFFVDQNLIITYFTMITKKILIIFIMILITMTRYTSLLSRRPGLLLLGSGLFSILSIICRYLHSSYFIVSSHISSYHHSPCHLIVHILIWILANWSGPQTVEPQGPIFRGPIYLEPI